jgi:hypothetical protein
VEKINFNKISAQVLSSQLISRNVLLESLQMQNNSISQIERGFYKPLSKLTRADFSTNICISETIIIARFIQWSSQLLKFKDCFNNYALLKSTNEVIDTVRGRMDDLETKVVDIIDRVDNDLKVLENKMNDSTDLKEFKTNLVDFFKNDQKNFESKYEADLTNITSAVKTDMMDEIKKNVVEVLKESQKTQQEKLVTDDFESFRNEFSGKFALIYCALFFIICFAFIVAFFVLRGQNLHSLFQRSQGDDRKLIDPEVY